MIEVIKYPEMTKEDIDADETSVKSEQLKVKENNGQDRQRTQAIKVRTIVNRDPRLSGLRRLL